MIDLSPDDVTILASLVIGTIAAVLIHEKLNLRLGSILDLLGPRRIGARQAPPTIDARPAIGEDEPPQVFKARKPA